ncbi:MAG: hypothetical protein QXS85_03855 [Acidilobaceae archaeon]
MGVTGCSVYYNKLLDSIVFTCSVAGSLDSGRDALELTFEATRLVSRALDLRLEVLGLKEWEFVAGRFNLFKIAVGSRGASLGEARVAELCRAPLVVSGVISGAALGGASKPATELLGGSVVEIGNVVKPLFLERAPSWEPVQRWVPRPAVYYSEGYVVEESLREWSLVLELASGSREVGLEELAGSSTALETGLHCVEGWSARISLHAVSLRDLLGQVPGDSWVYAESDRGYSAVVPATALSESYLAFAISQRGLTAPRLVFPELFGWKWVKRVRRIAVLDRYVDGYWEARGYHERGLVAFEERFKIRNPDVVEEGALQCVNRKPAPLA